MIFGIKTRKDKRIEELEIMLMASHFRQPQIIQTHKDVTTVGASALLEYREPVDVAKSRIAKEMTEYLKPHIHYDIEENNGIKVLKGYLNVVI